MDGEIHYRRVATRLSIRDGDRRLHATIFRWQVPVRLSNGSQEWFGRGSASVWDPPVQLRIKHWGPVAGRVIQWRSSPLGFDAVVLADETSAGDGVLRLVDEHGTLPLSPAWLGSATRHDTGREWTRVGLTHLAVCHSGELPWGRLRRLAA